MLHAELIIIVEVVHPTCKYRLTFGECYTTILYIPRQVHNLYVQYMYIFRTPM